MFNWSRRESGDTQEADGADREIQLPSHEDAESLFDSDIGPLLYAIEPELKRLAIPLEL